MAKMVGFACSVKKQWLDKAVSLLEDDLGTDEYKKQINEYLSYEIDSPTRLRKTREILMNIWYYESENIEDIRSEAVKLIKKYPDYSAAIYLCMIYLAYSVTSDIGRIMGRLFEYNEEVTNTIIKQKLYDEWGERGSLETTSRRFTLTLKELNLLDNVSKTRYKAVRHIIDSPDVVDFLIYVALKLENRTYYKLTELNNIDFLFPFDYSISKRSLLMNDKFELSTIDNDIVVSFKL